jgi:hypothetical protein
MKGKPGETRASLPQGSIPISNPFGQASDKPHGASLRERFDRFSKTHRIVKGKRDVENELAARTNREKHPAWLPEFTIADRRSGAVIYEHVAAPIDAATPQEELKYVCKTASQATPLSRHFFEDF